MINMYFKKETPEQKRAKLKELPLEELLKVDLIKTGLSESICRHIADYWRSYCKRDYDYKHMFELFKLRDLLKLSEKDILETKYLKATSLIKIKELLDYLGLSLKEEGKESPILDLIRFQELSEEYEACKRRGRSLDISIREVKENLKTLRERKKNCEEDAIDIGRETTTYLEMLEQDNSQYLSIIQKIYDETTINEEQESKIRKRTK